MPKNFLERNKKESRWALLLLLLRWKRGVIPQLLVVMLLMTVFFAPQRLYGVMLSAVGHIPLIGHRIAASLAPWTSGGDEDAVVQASKGSYQDLLAAISAARSQSAAAEAAARAAAAKAAAGSAGSAESTDLVRGKPEDIKGQDAIKGGASVAGVEKPSKDQTVQLSADDLQGQRSGFEEAGFGAGGQAGMLGSLMAGAGPFAGPNFFSGRNSAAVGDNLQTALGATNVPGAKSQIVPGNGGKLSRGILSKAALHPRAATRAMGKGGNMAFRQLADGRTRAMIARDPVCTTENGCAPEFATANTGAIYDGNRIGGATSGVITTGKGVGIDGIDGAPNAPTSATEATLASEADQITDDQKKCQAAEAKHKPVIDAYAKSIQDVSSNMHSGGCCAANSMPPGFKPGLLYAVLTVVDKPAVAGCGSESQARQCDNQGTNMSQLCQDLDNEMLAYYNECPLMQQDGPYQHYNCVKSCSTN